MSKPVRAALVAIATFLSGPGILACGSSASNPPGGNGGSGGSGGGGTGGTLEIPPDDFGTEPDRNRVQPGQVCERLSRVQCAAEQECCNAPGRTFEDCYRAQMSECGRVYLDQVSQDPITGYSVDAASEAFTEFERLAMQCDPQIALWSISPGGLRGITLGTVAPGAACTPANVTDFQKVAAHVVSCLEASTYACLPTGLTGLPPLEPWICSPHSGLDGPCFTDLNCVEGLYCNNNLDNPVPVGSQCKQRKASGGSCTFPNECQSLTCRSGSCVDATTRTAYCLAE
jgi:hypothetical protein